MPIATPTRCNAPTISPEGCRIPRACFTSSRIGVMSVNAGSHTANEQKIVDGRFFHLHLFVRCSAGSRVILNQGFHLKIRGEHGTPQALATHPASVSTLHRDGSLSGYLALCSATLATLPSTTPWLKRPEPRLCSRPHAWAFVRATAARARQGRGARGGPRHAVKVDMDSEVRLTSQPLSRPPCEAPIRELPSRPRVARLP